MDAPGDSAIGGTYVGNPVAHAAALAVLDVIEDEGLVARARPSARRSGRACSRWQERFAADRRRPRPRRDARHRARPRSGDEDGRARARDRRRGARDVAGVAPAQARASTGNCIRVLVPLVIADARARRGARRLGRGARDLLRLMRQGDEETSTCCARVPLFSACSTRASCARSRPSPTSSAFAKARS